MKFWQPLLWALLLTSFLPAETPEFAAEVNARRIGIEDTLVYKLSFRGIDAPLPPELRDLQGFQVLHRSHSSTFEFAGGRSTHTSTFLFYLKPLRTGRQEIPAAHTVAAGREYRTSAFTIEVVPGRVLPAPARPQNPFMPPWEEGDLDPVASAPAGRATVPAAGEIRLEAVLSKRAVLTGEPVVYSVRLLTQQSVDSVDLLSSPSFPGFWQEWLPVPTSVAGKTEIRGGKTFQVFEIRKAILFPSQSGTLEIPPLHFSITADGGPLALFSGVSPLERTTPPLRLLVKPLPQAARGLPVGHFRIQAFPDRERADAGELFPVHLTVTGDGNVKTIAPPTLAACPDYRTYPAKVASQYAGGDPPGGTLTVEIPVAFLRTGQVTFPVVEFLFYDPTRGRVESTRTVPFTVTVTGQVGAVQASAPGAPTSTMQDNPAPPMTDALPADPDRLPFGRWFWLLVATPFLLPLGLLGKRAGWDAWRRAHPERDRDRALREALSLLTSGSSPGDIPSAFAHYLTLRAAVPAGAATSRELAAMLDEHAVSALLRQRFLDLWQEASRLRYTPSSATEEATDGWRREAETILRSIDREWR